MRWSVGSVAKDCWMKLESSRRTAYSSGVFLLTGEAERGVVHQRVQRGVPPHLRGTQVIAACVGGNAEEPGAEVAGGEGVERTKRRNESLLRYVFRDCGVADHTQGYVVYRGLVALHQTIECPRITRFAGLQKRLLIHRRSLYSYFCEYSIPVCYHHTAQGRHRASPPPKVAEPANGSFARGICARPPSQGAPLRPGQQKPGPTTLHYRIRTQAHPWTRAREDFSL